MNGIRPWRGQDFAILLTLLVLGLALRSWSATTRRPPVGDERVYQAYVEWTQQHGFSNYADLVETFLQDQRDAAEPLLPPTRVVFVAGGRCIQLLTGWSAIESLRHFALLSSVGLLLSGWAMAWLLRGPPLAHGTLLLLAVSPLQLICCRYAFVDVAFAFTVSLGLVALAWAWRGQYRAAAAGIVVAFPLIVLTKESAAFIVPALLAGLWRPWRMADADGRRVLLLGVLGAGALSALAVGWLFGGLGPWLEAVLMLAAKTKTSQYSATYQNGPWFRYIFDYLLVAPVALLGFVFCLREARRELAPSGDGFLLFFGLSLLPMSLLEAGFNLRFALVWDPLLRLFLAAGVLRWGPESTARARLGAWVLVGIAVVEAAHFAFHFAHGRLYDPVTLSLLRALGVYRGDYLYDR
ncbi:MAG: hypothetical protein JSR82_01480 [Verrucomicrobia bacterium]|nr:hypothetical protein [Verrucomicrobiota bacterium]